MTENSITVVSSVHRMVETTSVEKENIPRNAEYVELDLNTVQNTVLQQLMKVRSKSLKLKKAYHFFSNCAMKMQR